MLTLSIMDYRFILVALFMLCIITSGGVWSQDPCSSECTCLKSPDGDFIATYDCRGKSLTKLPYPYLNTTTQIILSNNQIKVVTKGPLRYQGNLKLLYLQANLINEIETGAFDGLFTLTQLVLTGNRLQHITNGMFRHLPALEVLDLTDNQIQHIDRYAFFGLPSVYLINLKTNELVCGCEERYLRQFVDSRKGLITVQDADCTNIPTKAFDTALLDDFTPCGKKNDSLYTPLGNQFCYTCADANGIWDCGHKTLQQCYGLTSVCYNMVDFNSGHLGVWGGCMEYSSCIGHEKQNARVCNNDTSNTKCYFCMPETRSNGQDKTRVTKNFVLQALIHLDMDMTPDLWDTASDYYTQFTINLEVQVSNLIRNKADGAFVVTFKDLRSPRVTIALEIQASTMWFFRRVHVVDKLKDALMNSYYNSILPYDVTISIPNNDDKCMAETIQDGSRGVFTWPETPVGVVAIVGCPYQLSNTDTPTKTGSRACNANINGFVSWGFPRIQDCPHADATSRELQSIAETDINDGNAEVVSSAVSKLSAEWPQFDEDDVRWTVDIVEDILTTDISSMSTDVTSNTFNTINNILYIDEDILADSHESSQSSSRLLDAIDVLTDNTELSGKDFKAVKENIAAIASPASSTSFNGVTLAFQGSQPLSSSDILYHQEERVIGQGYSGIVLPNQIFENLSQNKQTTVNRISMNVFKDSKLFTSITPLNETKIILDETNVTREVKTTINSHVIGARIPGVSITNIDSYVRVTFQHLKTGLNPSCVFWDVSRKTWSDNGCFVNETTDTYTVCLCDHLTNFALLMDVYGSGGKLSEANKLALSIISYVGCGVSFVAVCLTMFTYLIYKKLRRDNPSKILMNLCLAIGLVDFIFVVGMQGYTSNNVASCKLVAILLHYFLLCAMFWMAVESFYMYLALVKVFDTYVARFQLKSSIFGWGLPLVIVVITIGINKSDNYGIQPGDICWLDALPFYAAFLAPVCIILIINSVMYGLVLKQILRRSTKKLSKTDTSNTAARVRGAISLVVLLGLTWIFAIFAVGDYGIVFHYLFAIFNSLQGLFIFIFYCLLKKDAQKCWKKSLPCFKSPYAVPSSSSNSRSFSDTLDSQKTMKTTSDLSSTKQESVRRNSGTETKTSRENTSTAFRGRWQMQS